MGKKKKKEPKKKGRIDHTRGGGEGGRVLLCKERGEKGQTRKARDKRRVLPTALGGVAPGYEGFERKSEKNAKVGNARDGQCKWRKLMPKKDGRTEAGGTKRVDLKKKMKKKGESVTESMLKIAETFWKSGKCKPLRR